ncbi:flagellar filament capping protein FliD [Colwelliaceae bacterium 6471]
MASLSSPGIGSGLDINDIVTQLIAAETEPFNAQHGIKQELITEKISGFGSLKSTLSELDDVLFKLKLPTTFNQREIENSSSNFSVIAGTASSPGSYDIEVKKVAEAQKITSQAFGASESIGSGTLDLTLGANTRSLTIEAGDTLTDIRDKVNETSIGVTATIVTGDNGSYLSFTSTITGLENSISVAITDDDGMEFDDAGLSRLAYNSGQTVLGQTFTAGETLNSTGDITLTNGSETANIAIAATDTIEDVVNNINGAGLNMTASLEDDGLGNKKLVLTSLNTYGDNQIGITINNDDDGNLADANGLSRLAHSYSPSNFTENQIASDAEILIDGSVSVTSSTNTFDSAIEGVEITALKSAIGTTETFSVDIDKASTKAEIESFVEAFNNAFDKVQELTKVDLEAETKGILVGDSTIRTMMSQIRRTMAEPIELSDGSTLSLSALGISTDRDGVLSVDFDRLDTMLESGFDNFGEFFTNKEPEEGIGRRLSSIIDSYRDTGGLIDIRLNSLQAESGRLDDEKTAFTDRMDKQEARLYAQFNAMDKIVATLNATGNFLTGQLENLPGVVKKD